jgi:exosortase E/protease (VPEID-CTERM system)
MTSPLWLYACIVGVSAWALRHPFQMLWDGSEHVLQSAAFHSVHAVLRFFLSDITVDAATRVIGTPRFAVSIEKPCSGMEGLGLVLAFTTVWLWYFRKESRFPQALLLVPGALGCIWLFNIIRICVIFLIGNAGAPDVAMVGFHSQAGWIAFTVVAVAFSMAAQKLSWMRRIPVSAASMTPNPGSAITGPAPIRNEVEVEEATGSSATSAYLVPFLAILAGAFVSRAASGYFEWLYPIRFAAGGFAIWHFRAEYKKLDWCFGWMAPVIGVVVFLISIAPTWWSNERLASPLGAALVALSPSARFVWILFRAAAAVITVPISEELAFRGYLARRLISRDFDTVSFSRLTVLSIGLSSVAFGLMYGQHWMLGILAGAAYSALLKWKGRIGDAVVAHAVSNLLLVVWVLVRSDWQLW